jgi:hypothetical protein
MFPFSRGFRWWAGLTILALAHVSDPAWSGTGTYFPLATGNFWMYRTPDGHEDSQLVIGPASFEGIETIAVEFDPDHENAGLRNYWTETPDGDLLFWGFYRSVEDVGVRYDPPIAFLDAPLEVGRTWQATTTPTYLPKQREGEPFVLEFAVHSYGPRTVPAGTFDAWEIGYEASEDQAEIATSLELDVTGRRLSHGTRGSGAGDWWTLGIGRIAQGLGSYRYELVSFELPTPVSAASWGRVKRLYR